jgi:putative restriction endonuclease
MIGYFGLTDERWFDYLQSRSDLTEVNFWSPSGKQAFRAIPLGAPFFFKLKSPRNAIGGFGFLSHTSTIPAWRAWDIYENMNGAPNRADRRCASFRAPVSGESQARSEVLSDRSR